ncbi:MAG: hypothetical protein Q9207_004534, partial [Kuettlingeria erythrocarpa]
EEVHRISVNNFEFGGSNAHVVIEDARGFTSSPEVARKYVPKLVHSSKADGLPNGHMTFVASDHALVFTLSALDEATVRRQADGLAKHLKKRWQTHSNTELSDLAYTLAEHRSAFPWKVAIAATSLSGLAKALAGEGLKPIESSKTSDIAFILTGQGAQWHAMGRELIARYPVFRQSLRTAELCLRDLGACWSLLGTLLIVTDELMKDETASQVNSAALSHPLTTAVQIAMVDLLASWNIKPTRVASHSSGEITAAYCAAAITLEGALALAYHRGKVSLKLKATRDGAMLAVGLTKSEAESHIATLTQGCVNIACVNGPASVTVSGDRAAISELSAMLDTQGTSNRKLNVEVAYHSHHMQDVAEDYLTTISNLETAKMGNVEFYSSVSGKPLDTVNLSAEYWVSNMNYGTTVDDMIEIGPHSALRGPLKQMFEDPGKLGELSYKCHPTIIRNTRAIDTCHGLVVQLLTRGCNINLNAVNFPNEAANRRFLVDLPSYPWNHASMYWAESAQESKRSKRTCGRNDLLGIRCKDRITTEPGWRNIVRASEIPWVLDHVVQGNTVYPAAGFLAMAIEAAHQRMMEADATVKGYTLREVTIGHALILSQDAGNVETVVSLRPYSGSLRTPSSSWNEFCVSSAAGGSSWSEHCRGLIAVQEAAKQTEVDGGRQARAEAERLRQMKIAFEEVCTTAVDIGEMYKALDGQGLKFGPTFTNLQRVRASSNRCVAEVSIPDTAAIIPARFEYPFVIHPATLDSCIHAVFPIGGRYGRNSQGTPVPTFIEEVFVAQNIDKAPGNILNVYAQNGKMEDDTIDRAGQHADSLTVFANAKTGEEPLITFKGLVFSYLANNALQEKETEERRVHYQTSWLPDPTFMSSAQIVELTAAFRKPASESDFIEQQAAFYYAEQALATMTEDEVTSMQPHHQKLYASLTKLCCSVRSGRLDLFSDPGWLRMGVQERAGVYARAVQKAFGLLLGPIGEKLPQILRQEIDPLSLMVEADRLGRYYRTYEHLKRSYQQSALYIKLLGHNNPRLNILEIGAGTGGATLPILETLSGAGKAPPDFANYDFTDISPAFFEEARDKLRLWDDLVKFKKLDIELNPISQGYAPASYDLIIAANVVHATGRVENTLRRIKSLLKPGGTLLLLEVTTQNLAVSLVFGTLPGWWVAQEEFRKDGPLLTDDQWDQMLHLAGFTGANATLWDMPDPASHQISTIISTTPLEIKKKELAVAVVTDNDTEPGTASLKSLLARANVDFVTTSLSDCNPKDQICLVLCELGRSVLRQPSAEEYEAVKRVFLESSGVLWVTEGALMESINPDRNLVTGLARTIRVEKGDTLVTTLDLDAHTRMSAASRAEKIFAVFMKTFAVESTVSTNIEYEYVERKGQILIPRLLEGDQPYLVAPMATNPPRCQMQEYSQDHRALKAEIQNPGLLDSIIFVPDDRIQGDLSEDCVEVRVKASGLNFRDVMTALGQISSYPLGCECCGVVSAVGDRVDQFEPDHHVIATVKDGYVCNVIRATTDELELVPHNIPFEVAAGLPVVYFTAYWAVFKTARLQKKENVLIHAGSGGLGQALINPCQLVGAEIFATVGTLEKKRLLMDKCSIPEDRIVSSRDTTFAKGIMHITKGKGVNVIMNSLSGEALRETWNCIAPVGRFIELGKRDFTVNSRLEMRRFEENVSFIGLDVPLDSQHGEKRRIWGEIMALFVKGSIKAPWPITVFGISETEKALRSMQSGKHMGKLVLVPQPGELVNVVASDTNSNFLRQDCSYLLVGGLGGIGRATASWMLKRGARNLIFASPSGSDKKHSQEAVALLRDQGACVAVYKCDISIRADLEQLLASCMQDMPPIRGMIHGALVMKADLFGRMSLQDYNDVLKPKVDGIWNLHNSLSKTDLDFFIINANATETARPRVDRHWIETLVANGRPGLPNSSFLAFRRAALGSSHTTTLESSKRPQIRESLRQAKSFEEAVQRACDEMVAKTAVLLMIPKEDIHRSKSLMDHGMDSLVAVEMRNWLLKELETALPILELMANTSLQQLSTKIVKRSKLVSPDLCIEEKPL